MRAGLRRVLIYTVLAHVLFAAQRLPTKVYGRRAEQLAHIATKGHADLLLRNRGVATLEVVQWLEANTPPDSVILYRGHWKGTIEILAALLHPRLLYFEAEAPPAATELCGRPLATGRLPGMGEGVLVLVQGQGGAVRRELR